MPIKEPDYQLPLKLDVPDETSETLSVEDIRLRSEVARNHFENGEAWKRDENGKPQPPMLMQAYYQLLAKGWSWRVAAYIIWLAAPRKYRYPQTQEELAVKVLGLTSDRQLSIWRTKNPVIDTLAREIGVYRVQDRLNDSIEAMLEVAATANYKGRGDREMHFKMAGILTDKIELSNVTDQDIQEVIKKMSTPDLLKKAGIDTPEKFDEYKKQKYEQIMKEIEEARKQDAP